MRDYAGRRAADRVHRTDRSCSSHGSEVSKASPISSAPARRRRSPRPPRQKSRRLVWFVDPETKAIEALEQSAKGASGWTPGRNVAMKRLHEQDPRLDYLSDHDRRALRTIRKTSLG